MGWPPFDPPEPVDPTDRALEPGDPISDSTPLFIVASGPGVGSIGTQEGLNATPGRVLLQEGTHYDPTEYPDLARFLAPYQGQHVVPQLSTPEWL